MTLYYLKVRTHTIPDSIVFQRIDSVGRILETVHYSISYTTPKSIKDLEGL